MVNGAERSWREIIQRPCTSSVWPQSRAQLPLRLQVLDRKIIADDHLPRSPVFTEVISTFYLQLLLKCDTELTSY